jgi:uncharacterized protein (TIGR03435 family)
MSMRKKSSALLVLATFAAPAAAQRPEFEVASVKHNTTNGQTDVRPRRSGDLVTMHNTQPYSMIFYAYGLKARYELSGYVRFTPDEWNWFDVDARIGRDATDDEVRRMFQSLLEDRFKLKVHREKREMPVYELTIAKGKPRLTPSSDAPMKLSVEGKKWEQTAGQCGTSMWLEGAHLVCHAVTMEQIAAEVSGALQAPAVDRSGLTGTYDLNVLYMPENQKLRDDTVPAPTFLQAFPDATGLKLEKGKGPVEVLAIDHMEKPAENQ